MVANRADSSERHSDKMARSTSIEGNEPAMESSKAIEKEEVVASRGEASVAPIHTDGEKLLEKERNRLLRLKEEPWFKDLPQHVTDPLDFGIYVLDHPEPNATVEDILKKSYTFFFIFEEEYDEFRGVDRAGIEFRARLRKRDEMDAAYQQQVHRHHPEAGPPIPVTIRTKAELSQLDSDFSKWSKSNR